VPVGDAIRYVDGILEALEYSHRAGVVHRDIKPGNVMVTAGGQVKVMDFGIARAVSDSSSTVAETTAIIGTAAYLSPEQAKGEPVDARADLYSAGIVLYELLTGRQPFRGESPVAVAYQHVSETPLPPPNWSTRSPARSTPSRCALSPRIRSSATRTRRRSARRSTPRSTVTPRRRSRSARWPASSTVRTRGRPQRRPGRCAS
jgi:serine/threonine protein kinase